MGLYNLKSLGNKEQKLANSICPICQTSGIIPVVDEPARDSFDYICNQCRQSFVISVSGSILASDYLERLDQDSYARKELQADIRQMNGKNYPIVTDTLSYFLNITNEYNYRSYNYADWTSGLLGSKLNLYNIPKEELEKITIKQKEIFYEAVEKKYNELISDLESRLKLSIRKDDLIRYELSTIKLLLQGEIQAEEGIFDLGNWKLPLNEIIKIQFFHRNAINGKLDLTTIVGPNQIVRVGSSKIEAQYKVNALAYDKYLNYIESINHKKSSSKSISQERLDYLKILYDKCEGNSSAIFNLVDIGKLLNWDEQKSRNISHTLMDFGYVEILTKEGDISLTSLGISKIEEIISEGSELNGDKYSKEELKNINLKIDSILEFLEKLDQGHEIIFDEIESLRADAQKFSKKDFKSMVLGKLFNLGIDGLLSKDHISEILKTLIGDDFNKYLK